MPIADHFGVLNVSNAVEQLKQVALGRVERKIADVKTRRSDFDRLGLTRRARLLLLWLMRLPLLLM